MANSAYIDSQRLIGFATSFETADILPFVRSNDGSIGTRAGEFVMAMANVTPRFMKEGLTENSDVFLINGVDDIDYMVQHAIHMGSGEMSQVALSQMFREEETIATIAGLARFSQSILRKTLKDTVRPKNRSKSTATFRVNYDTGTVQTTEQFNKLTEIHQKDASRGCPYASTGRERRPAPIFISFTKWAAALSIANAFSTLEPKSRISSIGS
jgi:hypothetical protein